MDAPFFLLREFLRVFAFYHQHSGDHEHAEGRDQQQAVFRRLKGSAERESPKEESAAPPESRPIVNALPRSQQMFFIFSMFYNSLFSSNASQK